MILSATMEVVVLRLSAERVNAFASHWASARTTCKREGGPHKPINLSFQAVPMENHLAELQRGSIQCGAYMVDLPSIDRDQRAPQLIHDPQCSDAEGAGLHVGAGRQDARGVDLRAHSLPHCEVATAMRAGRGTAHTASSIGAQHS